MKQSILDYHLFAFLVDLIKMLQHTFFRGRNFNRLHCAEKFTDKARHSSRRFAAGPAVSFNTFGGAIGNNAHNNKGEDRQARDGRVNRHHRNHRDSTKN